MADNKVLWKISRIAEDGSLEDGDWSLGIRAATAREAMRKFKPNEEKIKEVVDRVDGSGLLIYWKNEADTGDPMDMGGYTAVIHEDQVPQSKSERGGKVVGKRTKKKWQEEMALEPAFELAKDEVSCLCEEMQEWADNMEGTNLECTEKYQTISQTPDSLQEIYSELEGFPGILAEWPDNLIIIDMKAGGSRASRASGAAHILRQVAEALGNIEDVTEDMENQAEELEALEFPGAFG